MFTGTLPWGIVNTPLGNSPNVVYGYVGMTVNEWIFAASAPAVSEAHFYALSAPLTAIPEPATMILLGLGGLLAIFRRKRVG